MTTTHGDMEAEVKHWLLTALKAEDLDDNFTVTLLENTALAEGFLGDIAFVHVTGTTKHQRPPQTRRYDFVLKCGKKSRVLRDKAPIRDAFVNEMYVYNTVFPKFAEFERSKGVKEVFDSVPRCFGSYCSDTMEVLVLQNLKQIGYNLWDKKKPVPTGHMKLVLGEYGKVHAISAAMQDQRPEEFHKLTQGLGDLFRKFLASPAMERVFAHSLKEGCELLKGAIDDKAWNVLNQFREQLPYILHDMDKEESFRAIVHRDCWNNNFMYKFEEGNDKEPKQVAILDWQITSYASPVMDLSYYMYATISKEDLDNIDKLLGHYHDSFSKYVRRLGSDPDKIYPLKQLREEWQRFARLGVVWAFLVIKIGVTDKEDFVDMSDVCDDGRDLSEAFNYEVKNKDLLRERLVYLVEHLVERKILDRIIT